MVILWKHTLRNILKKPLRSLIIVFCMTLTCLTAYLMLDMSGAIEGILTNYMADMLGSVDVQVTGTHSISPEIFEELAENTALPIYSSSNSLAVRDPEQYGYEFIKNLNILSVNLEKAYQMEIFGEPVELTDQETAISRTYAGDYGLKAGDAVFLYDKNGGIHEFTVKYILPETGVFFQKGQYTAVVNLEAMKAIQCREELKSWIYLVDVRDDREINSFCQTLKDKYPALQYSQIKGDEQIQEIMAQITSIFGILFSVTFLMVIFVTAGLSERIVCERMAVIGTFKSLGISNRATTLILLLENAFYGLWGAIFASLLYGVIRDPILNSAIVLQEGETLRISPMQGWIYVIVFAGAILIQCACPVFELAKAIKTAIRDIIFSNRDTEYRISRRKTAAGVILLAAAVILDILFLKTNGIVGILSIIMLVVAMSFLMPLIMWGVSGPLAKLFERLRMPVASLAAWEIGSKKTTVANGVLCVTVSSLAIAVFALSEAMMTMYAGEIYNADVIAFGIDNKQEYYSFVEDLPGVEKVEYLYCRVSENLGIEGADSQTYYYLQAVPEEGTSSMFTGIRGIPNNLANDEFLMNERQAAKLGLSVGDSLEITFKTTYLFPIKKTLKLAAVIDTTQYTTTMPVIMITEKTFVDIYHNYIGGFLVKCQDPDQVKETVKKYSLDGTLEIYTGQEYQENNLSESRNLRMILYGMIFLGTILTLTGISGNQAVGFEGRKREYAVMHSTSMNKGQIRKLIISETLLSMGIGVVIAVFMGRLINFLLEKAVFAIGLPLKIDTPMTDYVKMGLILLAVLLLTCGAPVRALRKMNTAQELKYE